MARTRRQRRQQDQVQEQAAPSEPNGDQGKEQDHGPGDDGPGEAEATTASESQEGDEAAATGAADFAKVLEESEGSAEGIRALFSLEMGDSGLSAALSSLPVERADALWESWQSLAAEESVRLSQHAQEGEADGGNVPGDFDWSLLTHLVKLARWTIAMDHVKRRKAVPEGLVQVGILLHSILPLKSPPESLKNEVSLLCESWFCAELADRDVVIDNALTHLLKKSLEHHKRADIKRLWQIHESVLGHRLPAPDTQLHRLLLSAARSHQLVRTPEGSRFVTSLFAVSPSFVPCLHEAIKERLPGCPRQVASAYGEIYHKAWRTSSGSFRARLEQDCLQDLMHRSVVSNRALPSRLDVFRPCYHILERLHSAKNDRAAQSTLCRLWDPVLFRHLSAANGMVRRSAAEMLFAAFPVEDPDAPIEEKAQRHDRQYKMMLTLLMDPCPDVRVAAIAGVFRTISVFWLILPATFLSQAMAALLKDLAFDASTHKVRLAVLKGLKTLVSTCERSHLYLKKVLPKVSDCLHDVNEQVRCAMVDLLAEVKHVKVIKYWEVCSLDSLLVRLEVDKAPVCGRIVKLLFNSFFPLGGQDLGDEVKIQRCIYLIKKNRNASRRFYEHGEKLLKLHDCVKFMLAILVTLRKHARAKMLSSAADSSASSSILDVSDASAASEDLHDDEDKENNGGGGGDDGRQQKKRARRGRKPGRLASSSQERAGGDGADVSAAQDETVDEGGDGGRFDGDLEDPAVVAGLLDVVCIFWVFRSREIVQEGNAEYRSLLEKKSAKILTLLFKYYKSSEVIGPVVYLCSLLPHSSVATVAGFCLSRLKTAEMPDEEEWARSTSSSMFDAAAAVGTGVALEVPTYANALCNWGRGDDLVELLVDWIKKDCEALVSALDPTKAKSATKRKRGVRFAEGATEAPRPRLALSLVEYLLQHPVNRAILLRKNRVQLEELRDAMHSYLPVMKSKLSSPTPVEAKKLTLAWSLTAKLTVLLVRDDGDGATVAAEVSDALAKVEDQLEWLESEVLSSPAHAKSALGRELTASITLVCCNMVTVGVCDVNFIGHLLDLCSHILKQDTSLSTITLTSLACLEAASWAACNVTGKGGRRGLNLDTSQDAAMPVIYMTAVPELLGAMLQGLRLLEDVNVADQMQEVKLLRSRLQGLFDLYRTKLAKLSEGSFYVVLKCTLDTIRADLLDEVQKTKTVDAFDELQEVPLAAQVCLWSVSQRKPLMTAFLEEWITALETEQSRNEASQEDVDPHAKVEMTAAELTLLKLMQKYFGAKISRSGIKEVISLIEKRHESVSIDQQRNDDTYEDLERLAEKCQHAIKDIKTNVGMIA